MYGILHAATYLERKALVKSVRKRQKSQDIFKKCNGFLFSFNIAHFKHIKRKEIVICCFKNSEITVPRNDLLAL